MNIVKNLFFSLLFYSSLSATVLVDDITYVEGIEKPSLKDEFLNPNTKYYTLTVGALNSENLDIMSFFKRHNLENAVAYKYGKNKELVIVLSGLYESREQARSDIKSLTKSLQKNRPYSSKVSIHQKNFKMEFNSKKLNQEDLLKIKNSIFIANNKDAKMIKNEFLKKGSKYYSIALGTIDFKKDSIRRFFKRHNVSNKALAHLYGKNKDKVRLIYGIYKTKEEAKEALNGLSNTLKSNSPFIGKMKRFQTFYLKSYPNNLEDDSIVELKIKNKKENEKAYKPKINDEIKIIESKKKSSPPIHKKLVENKTIKKVSPKKIKKIKNKKKVIKKRVNKVKKIVKKDPNKNRFLKHSKLENVYFVESDGNFNILNEVFLKDGSSFFTIDLGELNLSEDSIEKFFLANGIKDDALAYKYGEKKEYARVIYGTYETKNSAKKAIEDLNIRSKKLRVSNIKNHQNLYNEYHKNIKSKKIVTYNTNEKSDILYINEKLKNKFLDKNSTSYTIMLASFSKGKESLKNFISKNKIENDVIAISLGKSDSYYKALYKIFPSFDDAKKAIENLNYNLKKNNPYISKVTTQQKILKKYNGKSLENQHVEKLEIK